MAPGTWLREHRLNVGKSIRDVAARVGVSHVFVSEMERGVRAIPLGRVAALAAAVGLDHQELRGRVVAYMREQTAARLEAKIRGAA